MKMQPKLITGAFAALLAVLGTAYAAENSGGGNPTSTPTWTVPVTQPSDITIKQRKICQRPCIFPHGRARWSAQVSGRHVLV